VAGSSEVFFTEHCEEGCTPIENSPSLATLTTPSTKRSRSCIQLFYFVFEAKADP